MMQRQRRGRSDRSHELVIFIIVTLTNQFYYAKGAEAPHQVFRRSTTHDFIRLDSGI